MRLEIVCVGFHSKRQRQKFLTFNNNVSAVDPKHRLQIDLTAWLVLA
jgi:hypothetical protein